MECARQQSADRQPGRSEKFPLRMLAARPVGVVVMLAVLLGCSPRAGEPASDPLRPSILLIVVDTLRADAVSAYGSVAGTTPFIDGLARKGVRYAHAYASSSWTLPSHVSLFTGLGVAEHGVGLRGIKMAPDAIEMLAETMTRAGYETVGFAENPVVGEAFGVSQGFETYASPSIDALADSKWTGIDPTNEGFGLLDRIETWVQTRDVARPYFLFVNIYDPHYSFGVRETNRFVPEGVGPAELQYASKKIDYSRAICDRLPQASDLEILRGLYLGDVAAADEKVGRILELVDSADRPLITVLTSDHGEHLGEHRLLSHRFTVHNEALEIPLIVVGAGAGDAVNAVVEQPVDLPGVYHSILCWAGESGCDAALPGLDSVLPPGEWPPVVSVYSDEVLTLPPAVARKLGFEEGYRDTTRDACRESDRVYGRMVAMLRYPFKLTWTSDGEMRLHDLSWDRSERSDLSGLGGPEANALVTEMRVFLDQSGLADGYESDPDMHPLDAEAAEALRSLGYID